MTVGDEAATTVPRADRSAATLLFQTLWCRFEVYDLRYRFEVSDLGFGVFDLGVWWFLKV